MEHSTWAISSALRVQSSSSLAPLSASIPQLSSASFSFMISPFNWTIKNIFRLRTPKLFLLLVIFHLISFEQSWKGATMEACRKSSIIWKSRKFLALFLPRRSPTKFDRNRQNSSPPTQNQFSEIVEGGGGRLSAGHQFSSFSISPLVCSLPRGKERVF